MFKMIFPWLLKQKDLTLSSKKANGFTLIELLMAAAMTLLVVGVSGWALMTVLNANKIAKAKSEMQYDFNRAVEFMTEEIKTSKRIEPNIASNLTTVAPSFPTATWKTPILAFQPDGGVGEYIVYYLVDTDASGASGKEWASRYVLYRWGPSYTNGTLNTSLAPSSWISAALVDMVAETSSQQVCTNLDYKRSPATNVKGFFVCVSPTGDFAEIHAYSQIEATGNKNAYLTKNKDYGIVTNVFPRGGGTNLVHGGKNLTSLFTCPATTANCPNYVVQNNLNLTFATQGATTCTFKVTNYTTTSSSSTSPVNNIAAGQQFYLEACSTASNKTPKKYFHGSDGTPVQEIIDHFTGTSGVSTANISSKLGTNVVNGKLSLAPNQFIAFFNGDAMIVKITVESTAP